MGGIQSAMKETMSESFRKQQDFMLETQKMQLGRQIAMQHMMGKKQMAMQMARQREMFTWVAAFTGAVGFFGLVAAMKSKKPAALAPLLPLGFLTAYQYDMAHGNKIERIRKDAEFILEETEKADFPQGDLTLEKVDLYKKSKSFIETR